MTNAQPLLEVGGMDGGGSSALRAILPPGVVVASARGDLPVAALPAVEEAAVRRAVERRRREFATGRACARVALDALAPGEHAERAIPPGPAGEPLWPAGIVGSVTHCNGYRACAVARETEVAGIGIDAEPNEPISGRVLSAIARAEEAAMVEELTAAWPDISWDRMLFSAKEAVYKVWYPLTGRRLGFESAAIGIDPEAQTFSARLMAGGPQPPSEWPPRALTGKLTLDRGILLTAIAVRRIPRSA